MNARLRIIVICAMLACVGALSAQNFAGMSGLIATPSADMDTVGDFRVGTFFLNNHFLPRGSQGENEWVSQGKPYNTMDFYLSLTPFKWVEIGFTMTLFKNTIGHPDVAKYDAKDRYFSFKFQPLSEGKYHPSIAIGSNDLFGSGLKFEFDRGNNGLFCNVYAVATKHFKPRGQDISVNLAYRYCNGKFNAGWRGVVGGITWRPLWVPQMRVVAEYNHTDINVGVDCLLWKHLFMQACLTDGRYFSGGLAFRANLF